MLLNIVIHLLLLYMFDPKQKTLEILEQSRDLGFVCSLLEK